MRFSLLTIILTSLFLASCSSSDKKQQMQTTDLTPLSQSDRNQIMNTYKATEEAWNEGDLKRYMQSYWKSDSLAFAGVTGPIYGYDTTLERYQQNYSTEEVMGELDFEVLKLYGVDQRTAILIGSYYLKRKGTDLQGYYTLVWHKFGDQWFIISDHTSGEEAPSDSASTPSS